MPGLFDGMRIAKTGIRVNSILQEVVGQNIANAANENHSRQRVDLATLGSTLSNGHFLGQGVQITKIHRIRDELLDDQLRGAASTTARYEIEHEWLQRLQTAYNEPSDNSVNQGLTNFWEAWSELSNDPESFATRSSVITHTENLAALIQDVDGKLKRFGDEIDNQVEQTLNQINGLTTEIAQLNKDIFRIEAGGDGKSNDLRDKRDAVLDDLSEMASVSYSAENNGMLTVFIGSHPAVIEDSSEKMVLRQDTMDPTKMAVGWQYGDQFKGLSSGRLSGILNVRDNVIPGMRSDLDAFVSTVITETNKVYSNGVPMDAHTLLESRLGYDAFGVKSATTDLDLVASGTKGSLTVSFYDSSNNAVRMHGIMIDDDDSLSDIATKLGSIPGLDSILVSDTNNDGRLRISLDTISGENIMGETTFAISNNTGGYDTSGFLALMGYSQTDKTSNAVGVAPVMASRDVTELQTVLGEPNVASVRAAALGMSGSFTINAFETDTETAPKTNGHIVEQLRIEVASTDSIDDVIAKVNTLTAQYGVTASFNGVTNKMEITHAGQTDTEGNVVLAGGTNYLRLGFANDYRYPTAVNDEPPAGYSGAADTTGLLTTLQFNTLFQGSSASDISIDERISGADDIHAGFKLTSGDNTLALAMAELQFGNVSGGQFTINESYQNIIADVGTSVQQANNLNENESLLLQAFEAERDRISGVNLDEELATMIQFQRAYEANAKMFSIFNQMAEEILRLQ